MTDTTITAPTATRSPNLLPRLRLPCFGIAASLKSITGLLGDGLNFACVDPFANVRRQPQVVPDDDLEGRDPNW